MNVLKALEGRPYLLWATVICGVEAISLLTIFTSVPNTIAVLMATLIVFLLAWKKPTIAMGVMMLELLVGSKGYLLQFGGWPSSISLRILMTAAFFLGWAINFLKHGTFWGLIDLFEDRRGYLVLFILISYANVLGILMGNQMTSKDANAWMDWFLLLPVLEICWRYRATVRRDLAPIFWVAVYWLAIKSLLLEYVFSHAIKFASQPLYLWVRRTGVAEVTLVVGNAFRIFMQSYVFAVAAWIASLTWWLIGTESSKETQKYVWWMMTVSAMILGLSLSRSFWIGAMAGSVCLLVLLWGRRIVWWKRLRGPVTAVIAGVALIAAILAVPLPPVRMASLVDLFGSRASTAEAAVGSRWNLLPILWHKIMEHPILGSGFGATVTYKTLDPRIVAQHSDGMYTTYAFEWGWLEHWIKFGILGIPLIAYLLFSLGRRLWRLEEPLWLRVSCVSSLIALVTLHFFTPYLNHPLGFLFFFVGEGIILSSVPRKEQSLQSEVSPIHQPM